MSRLTSTLRFALLFAATFAAVGSQLQPTQAPAAGPSISYFWDGSGTSWNTPSDWSTAQGSSTPSSVLPGASDAVTFNTSILNADQTLTLDGNQSVSGMTFASAGAVTINQGTSGTLTLVDGGLTLLSGAGLDTINAPLSLTGGESWTAASGTTLTDTGTVTRNVGSTVNFSSTGTFNGAGLTAIINASTANGWATYGGNTWAIISGGNVASLTNYISATAATTTAAGTTVANYTGKDIDVTSSPGVLAGAVTINSVRFNTAVADTFTLTGTNVVTSGGILVTSAVGNNLSTITGGTLEGANSQDLTIIQNNTANGLTIASVIANNTGTTGLTKSGLGTVTISSIPSYTGATTVNGGTLILSNPTSSVGTYVGGTVFIDGASTFKMTLAAGGSRYDFLGKTVNFDSVGGGTFDASGVSNFVFALASSVTSNIITNGGAKDTIVGALNLGGSSTDTTIFNVARGTDATADLAVTGVMGNAATISKTGNGILLLSAANGYTGSTTINAGTLKLGTAGSGANSPLGTIGAGTIVSATGAALDLNGFTLATAEPLSLIGTGIAGGGALTNSSATGVTYSGLVTLGNAASIVAGNGNISLSNTGTITGATFGLTLDGSAAASSIASIIGTTTGTLTKNGTGTWSLGGNNTFTGATTINNGKLYLNGTNATTSISVAGGATLGGTGSAASAIATVASSGIIEAGSGGAGKMTLGGLTFSGTGSINFGSLANYSAATGIQVTDSGLLNPTGGSNSVAINIASVAGAAPGTYKLIGYTGSISGSGSAAFKLGTAPRMVSSFNDTGSEIDLVLTSTDFIKWTGAGTLSSGWDTTTPNWILNSTSAPTTYIDNPGDIVVFDNGAGSSNSTVNLNTANVSPASVTFNNSAFNYTLQGSFGIAGTTGLTLNGTARVALNNANSFTGGVTINAGVLQLGNAGALNSATPNTVTFGPSVAVGTKLQLNGNSVTVAGLNSNATPGSPVVESGSGTAGTDTLTVNTTTANTFAGVLQDGSTRSLALAKSGTGSLALSGNNTYSGGTSLSAGTLNINSATALGTGTVTITGGALDNTSGAAITLTNNNAENWNGSFTFNGGAGTTHDLNLGTGTVTLNAARTVTANAGTLTLAGTVAKGSNILTISGTGTVNITGGLTGTGGFYDDGNATYSATGGATTDFRVGNGASGNFTISAGDLTVSTGSDILMAQNGTVSTFTQTGGTLNFGSSFFKGANNAAQTSNINVSGGTWNETGTFMTNQRGAGTLTISGTANMTVGLLAMGGWVTDTKTSTVNLNGGTLTAAVVSEQITGPSTQGVNSGTTSVFNFNGGTLKPSASTSTFMTNIDTVNVMNGGAIIDTNSFNITIAKALTHFAGATTDSLTKNGAGALTLSAAETYAGTTRVNGGALNVNNTLVSTLYSLSGGSLVIGGSNVLPTASAITLTGGTLNIGANNNTVATVSLQSGSITGASGLLTNNTNPFDVQSGSVSAILDGSAGLTKSTSGVVTLTGANTYTGPTAVNAGNLYVNSPGSLNINSAVSVANQAVLGGTGRVNGTVTVASGGIIEAGSGGTGQLTVGALNFSGTGSVNFGALANYAGNTGVSVIGSLTPSGGNGSVTINVTNVAGVTNSTYRLISYSGTDPFAAFQLAPMPNRTTGILVDNVNEIDVSITGTDFLVWSGAGNGNWNTSAANNWKLNSNGNAATYIDNPGDVVVLDDSVGSGLTTVNIDAADVHPTSVTFNNSAKNYTVKGSFGIAGNSGLTMSGSGMVTLNNPNAYTGVTAIQNGTLRIGSGGSIASTGSVVLGDGGSNSGILALGDGTAAVNQTLASVTTSGSGIANQVVGGNVAVSTLTINNASPVSFSGILGGSGANQNNLALIMMGTSTLTLSGANTFSGGLTIATGTLSIPAINDAGGTGPLGGNTSVTLGSTSATGTLEYSGATAASTMPFALATSGTGAFQVDSSGSILTLSGVIGSSGSLSKTGAGTLVLTGANTYTGTTTLGGGALRVGSAETAGTSGPLGQSAAASPGSIVFAGGTLQFSSANTNDYSGRFSTAANQPISIDTNGQDVTFATPLSSVGGSLAKLGGGILTLTAANTYTGATTVSGGILEVPTGGSINNGSGSIVVGGASPGGALNLTGGAITSTGGNFYVGKNDNDVATVNISSGTATINTDVFMGGNTPATGIAATWNQTGGTVIVSPPDDFYVGGAASSNGSPLVSVSGGSLTVNAEMWLAVRSNSTLTISNTGAVTVSRLRIGLGGQIATVNLNGGTLTMGGADDVNGASHIFNFNGGLLKATNGGTLTDFMVGFLPTVQAGGAFIDTQTLSVTINQALATDPTLGSTPDGGLTLQGGPGNLTLSGTNTYTGPTTINAGLLTINGSLAAASTVTVNDNTALSGTGTINGPVILAGGPTGDAIGSAGTLSLANTLTVGGNNNVLASGTVAVAGATTINIGAHLLVSGTLTGAATTTVSSNANLVVNGTINGSGNTSISGTLRGTGTISQAVTVNSGGAIAGTSGSLLTLSAGLTLSDGSLSNFAITTAGVNNATALVAVTGGLIGPATTTHTINFTGNAAIGTYDLYSYDNGAPTLSQFTLGTLPTGNFSYHLGIANNQIDLIVGTPASSATWNYAGDGVYSDTTKWLPAQLPNAVGLTATFGGGTMTVPINSTTVGGNAISVAIDGAYTAGSLAFDNATVGYSLTSDAVAGHGLTLDNGGAVNGSFTGAVVAVNTGSHTIAANLTLADSAGTTFSLASGAALSVSGVIAGSGANQSLSLAGGGMLTLSNSNSYNGGNTVNAGTLRTAANGALGTGPLAVNSSGTATPLVDVASNESVGALTGGVSGTGSATVRVEIGKSLGVASTSGTSTFAGTVNLAAGTATPGTGGALVKSGAGTEVLTGAVQLNNSTALNVSGGTLRVNASGGTIGIGVTANVSGSGALELAGAYSALGTATAANRAALVNNSTATAGVLVSSGNQQVGGIDGSGTVQITPPTGQSASLTADHITAGALVIGGDATSSAVVTIAASNPDGTPMAQATGFALDDSLASSSSFASGTFDSSSLLATDGPSGSGSILGGAALGSLDLGGSVAAVPEPSTIVLFVLGILACLLPIAQRRASRSQALPGNALPLRLRLNIGARASKR